MPNTPTTQHTLASTTASHDHDTLAARSDRQRSLVWPATACFVLVTFFAAGGLAGLQSQLGLDLEIIEIVQFAPTIGVLAVLIMRAITRRDVGSVPLPGLSRVAEPQLWKALVAPLLIMTVAAIGFMISTGSADVTSPYEIGAGFGLVLVMQLVGAWAEEVGWRGYLQPTLQRRWRLVPTATVVGLLWGCWHVQIFGAGPAYAAAFLLSTVSMSITMAVLTENLTRGKSIVAGVFHWAMNIGMLLSLPEESGDVVAMLWIALGCTVGAALSLLLRRQIARRPVNAYPTRRQNAHKIDGSAG